MGARFLDWMAMNKAFVTGLAIGIIIGGVLGMIGAYFYGG